MAELHWIALHSTEQVDTFLEQSHRQACMVFKHSSRCDLSAIAKYRLETDWDFSAEEMVPLLVDVVAYPALSRYLAEKLAVYHESPQVLLLKKGECTYEAAKLEINVPELRECYEDDRW
ncbi:MAG: bacillithiol system redox-active protein YtxJ [Lewinellaceae bacterium]|nr:bacillithiol system redox-active protein YtxJ [Lewinellaceae bacterium]